MLKSMTRKQLYEIEKEIIFMQKDSPALALLLSKQIDLFLNKAGFNMKMTKTRFDEIKQKYIQKDAQGNFMTVKVGEDKEEWKLIENRVDLEKAEVLDVSQVREIFNSECAKLFNQTIQFDW